MGEREREGEGEEERGRERDCSAHEACVSISFPDKLFPCSVELVGVMSGVLVEEEG